jgi:predicted nucleic acid-binding protein
VSAIRGFPPRRALVDTGAYYALSDRSERRHIDALAIRERLVRERWRLFTTNFIVAETHALHLSHLGYYYAQLFLEQLDQSPTVVVRVSRADELRARQILRRYDDKKFSYTDATSFAVMERLGMTHSFTFDGNFAQYQFTVLAP